MMPGCALWALYSRTKGFTSCSSLVGCSALYFETITLSYKSRHDGGQVKQSLMDHVTSLIGLVGDEFVDG